MLNLDKTDKQILLNLYRYRYLTRPLISQIGDDYSLSSWHKKLARLYKNGFIDRPAKQLWHIRKNEFAIYALAQKGADFLTEHYDIKFPRTVKWREKNTRYRGQDSFSHPLETARFMVGLESDLLDHGSVLLHQDKITGTNYVEGTGWETRIATEFELISAGLKPDGIFSVYKEGDSNPINFFLEIDRGTMPIRSKNISRSSIYKKYLSYAYTHENDLASENFSFSNFRVLMVTTSPARKLKMMELWESDFSHLPNLILFSSFPEIKEQGILNAWRTCSGHSEAI